MKHALAVDPDSGFTLSLKKHLEEKNFEVVRASSLEEADRALAERDFDLVVTEIRLEVEDGGLILARHVRKKTPSAKIVIVTDVTAATGEYFELDDEFAKRWIFADAILDKEIRMDQLDRAAGLEAPGEKKP